MHISCLFNSRMQPEDLLIFSLKEHHLLNKIIVKPSLHLFLKGEIHVLNLNKISAFRIDSLLIFCILKLICRDQNKNYNFHLLISSRLSATKTFSNWIYYKVWILIEQAGINIYSQSLYRPDATSFTLSSYLDSLRLDISCKNLLFSIYILIVLDEV